MKLSFSIRPLSIPIRLQPDRERLVDTHDRRWPITPPTTTLRSLKTRYFSRDPHPLPTFAVIRDGLEDTRHLESSQTRTHRYYGLHTPAHADMAPWAHPASFRETKAIKVSFYRAAYHTSAQNASRRVGIEFLTN